MAGGRRSAAAAGVGRACGHGERHDGGRADGECQRGRVEQRHEQAVRPVGGHARRAVEAGGGEPVERPEAGRGERQHDGGAAHRGPSHRPGVPAEHRHAHGEGEQRNDAVRKERRGPEHHAARHVPGRAAGPTTSATPAAATPATRASALVPSQRAVGASATNGAARRAAPLPATARTATRAATVASPPPARTRAAAHPGPARCRRSRAASTSGIPGGCPFTCVG